MEGDQSGLSLKGCQARRNPIQYQYRGTTGRVGELLGSAAVSLTVVSAAAAAACQRPPSHTIVPPLPTPPTVPNTGQDRQMGCLGSLPREHSRGDEYQPVEEETASLPSWSRDVWIKNTHFTGPEGKLFFCFVFFFYRFSYLPRVLLGKPQGLNELPVGVFRAELIGGEYKWPCIESLCNSGA